MAIEASTDLLISQWRFADNLRTIIQIHLDVKQEYLIGPLERTRELLQIDEADGVWLDWIGARLGLPRPWAIGLLDDRWGFDNAGTPFDQGRLSNLPDIEARSPIADLLYRNLLKARSVALLSHGDVGSFRDAVEYIDADAVVVDGHDMSFTVTTARRDALELAGRVEAIPRPAGVTMTIIDA